MNQRDIITANKTKNRITLGCLCTMISNGDHPCSGSHQYLTYTSKREDLVPVMINGMMLWITPEGAQFRKDIKTINETKQQVSDIKLGSHRSSDAEVKESSDRNS